MFDRNKIVVYSCTMPAKNSIKIYSEDSYYHIYNRGVEKRLIFQDEQDYGVFLSYLKNYLLPKNEEELRNKLADPNLSYKEKEDILKLLRLKNFSGQIMLLTYCLMPNHFHLLIKQRLANTMDRFIKALCTRYTMYFNSKYKRVGPLYQGVYKAVLVRSDQQLLYLTTYIHRNPLGNSATKGETLRAVLMKQPSSYPDYLKECKTEWVYPEEILSFFSKNSPAMSYQTFVEQTPDHNLIKDIAIDL